jgi:hypothetical protein
MILSVEEATGKWCTMVRKYGGKDLYPHNRDGEGRVVTGSMCLGDKCMMWRWMARTGTAEKTRVSSGYCGLAGKPVQD